MPPVATNVPGTISNPADALALLAVRKGLDAQVAAGAAIIALLDVNVGTRLNVSA
jgi:hypothetical protein